MEWLTECLRTNATSTLAFTLTFYLLRREAIRQSEGLTFWKAFSSRDFPYKEGLTHFARCCATDSQAVDCSIKEEQSNESSWITVISRLAYENPARCLASEYVTILFT